MLFSSQGSHTRYLSLFMYTLIVFVMGIVLVSCSEDEGVDGPVDMQLWDIVTYTGPANNGTGSRFTFRQVDDLPEVELTSVLSLPDEVSAGDRLVIRYIPESGKPYVSGPVRLLEASRINQGEAVTVWKSDYDKWNRDSVFIYSVWRTGIHVNFHLRLTYSKNPRIFTLVLDPSTVESEIPVFYLAHIMSDDTDNHDRVYFASFDISEIWDKPSVRGVKVRVANTNLDKDIFTFMKTN